MDREQEHPQSDRGAREAGEHRRRLTVVVALALLVPSCGYRFSVGEGRLADGGKALCIPIADNRTLEVAAGACFTEALRREAVRAGLDLVDDKATPVLNARVLFLSALPRGVALSAGRFVAREEEVTVEVELSLTLAGRPPFQQKLLERESYLVAPDLRGTEANRELAWKRAIDRLARRGLDALAREF